MRIHINFHFARLSSNLWYKPHVSKKKCWSLRCNWSTACRHCSNYIFILDLTLGVNRLGKDNYKTRWEIGLKIWCALYHEIKYMFRINPDVCICVAHCVLMVMCNSVSAGRRRDRFVNAPNHWETTLYCNDVSHWLGTERRRYNGKSSHIGWAHTQNNPWICNVVSNRPRPYAEWSLMI